MFNGVRLRLTTVYLVAGLVLVALLGAGVYQLLSYYFSTTTDLALQHRMAHELTLWNAPVPAELVAADQAWYADRSRLVPLTPTPRVAPRTGDEGDAEHDEEALPTDDGARPEEIEAEHAFDGALAAIFVLPLGNSGTLLPGGTNTPMAPDIRAAAAAGSRGSDIRTVRLASGVAVRLLSYRVESDGEPAVLQLGRTLVDQDRILNALLVGLVSLGGASTLLLSGTSYWLAGRSLRPAQLAWQRQQTFIANASHELRTPLTLVRASADVARRTTSDRSQHALLDDILQECDHMAKLVDDLLTLSRLDAKTLPMQRQRIELQPFLDDIVRQVNRVAAARGAQVIHGVTHGAAYGDPLRLRQVMLIVIDNALHYTASGGVIRLESERQRDRILISVTDTGYGIAPEHLPHVFERFYRVDSTPTEQHGAGLGLSLAQALMRLQGGEIHITSTPGKGTCVTLSLSTREQ